MLPLESKALLRAVWIIVNQKIESHNFSFTTILHLTFKSNNFSLCHFCLNLVSIKTGPEWLLLGVCSISDGHLELQTTVA